MTRFCCKQKEQRRQRMYEKALDACATSPFARGISKWVLAGDVKSSLFNSKSYPPASAWFAPKNEA